MQLPLDTWHLQKEGDLADPVTPESTYCCEYKMRHCRHVGEGGKPTFHPVICIQVRADAAVLLQSSATQSSGLSFIPLHDSSSAVAAVVAAHHPGCWQGRTHQHVHLPTMNVFDVVCSYKTPSRQPTHATSSRSFQPATSDMDTSTFHNLNNALPT